MPSRPSFKAAYPESSDGLGEVAQSFSDGLRHVLSFMSLDVANTRQIIYSEGDLVYPISQAGKDILDDTEGVDLRADDRVCRNAHPLEQSGQAAQAATADNLRYIEAIMIPFLKSVFSLPRPDNIL
mmetsp:Transcript_21386/g.59359  ORF Transcript_21386/g.59359 Transcript_21386/m.59359 type:complete len:126 (-) Transcript_21386:259-636(-)|eukprot:CAMPEP_0117657836 /NCGR_PEP_ID=MMETSP0804-20121206/5542_1 /TAXON_ID=1074897 /ORGANISM="Tetraselmis astigmatica, Strain CCMP880" /LENGTH=125 /DNA_ID=CAMNT_0005464315 /DNA_START=119 /DNA_END=496 /DNA_ORIENTATION=-